MAIVLHNARLYGQRLHELETVSRFQAKISTLSATEQAEIEEVSHEAVNALKAIGLYTDDMYVILYDSKENKLRTPLAYEDGHMIHTASLDNRPNYRTRKLEERNGLQNGILVNDVRIGERPQGDRRLARTGGLPIRPQRLVCWMGTPMNVRGETAGVMVLRSFTQENRFNESHIELVQTIANQAAITIANAGACTSTACRKPSRWMHSTAQVGPSQPQALTATLSSRRFSSRLPW